MSTKDLTQQEAAKKLKELAERARICMFCTNLDKLPNNSRPMSLQECSEDGSLWFISDKESHKNMEIRQDNRVQLYFMNNGDAEYLHIYGKASIYTDRQTIEEQWSPMANAWFDGKEDPNVTIIRVEPTDSYYWDTKAGKFVTMLSFMAAAVGGGKHNNEDGVEGKLTV